MGTGNGEIALKAAEKGADVTAADINPEAIEYSSRKAEKKGLKDRIKFKETDLFQEIEDKFDIVIFNPPYLPGEEDIGDQEIWQGGEKGTEVTEKFLEKVDQHLKKGGTVLTVGSSKAELEGLEEKYRLDTVKKKQLWFEDLKLLKMG